MRTTKITEAEKELIAEIAHKEPLEVGWDTDVGGYYYRIKVDGQFKTYHLNNFETQQIKKELQTRYRL